MEELLESCQECSCSDSCNPRSLHLQEFTKAYHINKRKVLNEKWAAFFYESNIAFSVARHPVFIAIVKARSTIGFDEPIFDERYKDTKQWYYQICIE